ncbi:MAG: hypothetical protein KKI08_17225, partial [Armatimonadetes bacterium]|nr:hypothetical protein [Armatimonadota bacterium]
AYDLYGERQLDALQQAHWAQSSRAELEAHFASLSPAELWRQAYRLILNQFENLTGDRLETWARREVTMHLWQDMFPSTVNRILGYDASGMNDRQKIAALSRNPEYTGLVQRKVDTMFAGRLRVSALLAWLEQAPVNAGTITPAQAAALLKP